MYSSCWFVSSTEESIYKYYGSDITQVSTPTVASPHQLMSREHYREHSPRSQPRREGQFRAHKEISLDPHPSSFESTFPSIETHTHIDIPSLHFRVAWHTYRQSLAPSFHKTGSSTSVKLHPRTNKAKHIHCFLCGSCFLNEQSTFQIIKSYCMNWLYNTRGASAESPIMGRTNQSMN